MTKISKTKPTTTPKMSDFGRLVEAELISARQKHPGVQHSLHEGYAVLLEEVDEFWDWVKTRSRDQDPVKIYEELIQIAAMAQRTAEDVLSQRVQFYVKERIVGLDEAERLAQRSARAITRAFSRKGR